MFINRNTRSRKKGKKRESQGRKILISHILAGEGGKENGLHTNFRGGTELQGETRFSKGGRKGPEFLL